MNFKEVKNFNEHVKKIKDSMIPTTKDNYIGLELEISSKVPHAVIAWEMAKAGIKVDVGTDGSIKRAKNTIDTAEIRVLVKQSEVATMIPIIVSKLKELGAAVNASCGLHVHLDMRNRKVTKCYKRLVDSQEVLRKMVAKSRLDNRYCKMNTVNDFNKALKGTFKMVTRPDPWNPGRTRKTKEYVTRPEGRASINPEAYGAHQTLEVRLHEGTLNDKKIITWVNKLVEIVDGAA